MAKRVSSSEGPVPESTAAVLRKMARSRQMATRSEASETTPAVARPSSTQTGPQFSFDADEELDPRTREVVMVIGALLGQGFNSSGTARKMIMDLQQMGLYPESKALADGFSRVRTQWMQDFMG